MINVAIIPARGGSKRIPRKNIRNFCGKPIIAYSIEAAKKSTVFDRVIVSTDDEEIAKVAIAYGAEVPFMRPATLADDYTGTNDVVLHAIKALQQQGEQLNLICCIYATAPFLQSNYIIQAKEELLKNTSKRFAFSVNKYSYPIQRAFTLEGEEKVITPIEPESIPKRSQDLPDVYHDAGQFYLANAQSFLKGEGGVFSASAIPITLPNYLVQDIDNEEDWVRAEMMFLALKQKANLDDVIQLKHI